MAAVVWQILVCAWAFATICVISHDRGVHVFTMNNGIIGMTFDVLS